MCYSGQCHKEDYMGNCTVKKGEKYECPPCCGICKFKDHHTDDCLREREGLDCAYLA